MQAYFVTFQTYTFPCLVPSPGRDVDDGGEGEVDEDVSRQLGGVERDGVVGQVGRDPHGKQHRRAAQVRRAEQAQGHQGGARGLGRLDPMG